MKKKKIRMQFEWEYISAKINKLKKIFNVLGVC